MKIPLERKNDGERGEQASSWRKQILAEETRQMVGKSRKNRAKREEVKMKEEGEDMLE